MSRIGKKPIAIPEGTTVTVNGLVVTVKGKAGEISRTFKSSITIEVKGAEVILTPKRKDIETNALWGTYASHIGNMIEGVNTPFEKKLILEGIGFKVDIKGTDINLSLGFSHPVKVIIPKGVKVTSEKGIITISGIDKDLVGQFAAGLRDKRKPEPYKGKGFRYEGEVIRRKQGKKAA